MKKKLYNKDVQKQCDVCFFGKLSEDKQSVLCPKKGIMERVEKCRHFSYDATKREPKQDVKLPDYCAEDFKID